MFNRTTKSETTDLNHDVTALADTLDELLKSYGSQAKEGVDDARSRAESLLKETRAKLQGPNAVTRAARDAGEQVNSYVQEKPWHGVGIGAALGVFLGALIVTATSSSRR
ncbi:DUF883 family protein [Erwinia sp. E602]|uniref:DUF883 family protein n=1 Tax=unclassified Erwinia TaxID=2622719 RepID=UPI0006FF266C|nr:MULTISPECIES: DUF883 family protein [unclassified Erwinia]KQN54790.1 hypothetical protein ASF13_10090 [Erwinia sp. Leaf53]PLV57726.1 membrane protein [Erwinia sp. B116]QUG74654.1 DUF883 family protein [Erwinia sp. E602]